MPNRYYSSAARDTTLSAGVTSADTLITVGATTGFPASFPYTLAIDVGGVDEELVTVTAAAGTTLTVTRGVDGTTALAHSAGAVVQHVHSARDFREPQDHMDATAAHGATGAVVGTTNTQVLTNKDLTSGTNTFPATLATTATAQALSNKDLTAATNTFPTSLVTLTGAQTLTNKTLTDPTLTTTETWHTVGGAGEPAFTNGYATSAAAPQFRKGGTGDTVFMRGSIDLGTDGATAFTLPAGYRPTATVAFMVPTDLGASTGLVQLEVKADGTVVFTNKGSGAPAFASCACSFSLL